MGMGARGRLDRLRVGEVAVLLLEPATPETCPESGADYGSTVAADRLTHALLGSVVALLVLYGVLTWLPPSRYCHMPLGVGGEISCVARWGPLEFPVPYVRQFP